MVEIMTLHILDQLTQGSDEWHDARRGIVTASVVGKLLTPTLKVADNDTSRGLAATLVAERITGLTESSFTNDDMWRGVVSEPIARDLYSAHYQQAEEIGFLLLEEDGWQLGYSPDGLVGVDGLIEVKAPRPKTHIGTILADAVPTQHLAQIQAGLVVTGRAWCDFVSFAGGLPMFVKRVHPDPAWFEAIEAACRAFESAAVAMVADYRTTTRGLPVADRLPDLEEMRVA